MNRVETIGDATLHFGDCREVLPTLDPADITITSPPYNMGLVPGGNGRGMYRPGASNKAGRFRDGYGTHADALPQVEYDNWQRECLSLMFAKSALGVFYNHRPRVEHGSLRTPLSFDYGIPLRQIIIWDRGTGIDVNLRHFCTRQEWILVFAKPQMFLIDHAASGGGDVWRLGIEHSETGHPAPFPIALPETILRSIANVSTVIDPFMGSGTTGIACHRVACKFVGIENDPQHFDNACRRIEAAQRQPELALTSTHKTTGK
jgi:site-specific DNA-methyltransferase (adenine-specific)